MATPARKLEHLREQLFDHSVRKHELWLHGVRKEIEGARRRGETTEPEFHDLMGVIFGHLEDYEAAVRYGRVAVELAPDWKIARHNLAVSLTASDRSDEAMAILEDIVHRGLAVVDDYTSLVAAYAYAGKWKSSRTALAAAMASADLHNVDHLWRLTHAAAQAGKYTQAVELFGRYLAARAGDPEEEVTAAPLAYVQRVLADHDRLKDVPDVPEVVSDAIQRATLSAVHPGPRSAPERRPALGNTATEAVPDAAGSTDAQDEEATAVFDAFAAVRRRATPSVIPDDE